MDEMKFISNFLNGTISKVVGCIIRKKVGVDTNIDIKEIHMTTTDNTIKLHLDLNAEMKKEDVTKLLKSLGVM